MSEPIAPAAAPPNLQIRAKAPSPKRLSRRVLLAGALCAGAIIAFALVNGLSERETRRTALASGNAIAAAGPPENIEGAIDQYGAGDLNDSGDAHGEDALTAPLDPIWAGAPPAAAQSNIGAGPTSPADSAATTDPSPILFAGELSRSMNGAEGRLRLAPPASRYEIKAGDMIPAALVTALNSDLPGRIVAQVTQPVFDTVTGRHLLIPQGSRLIGSYDATQNYGEERVVLVWNRLILPDGWSINLGEMSGTDASGATGLGDRVDNHLDRLAVAIGLSAIVSVIAHAAEEEDDDASLSQSLGDSAAQQAAATGGRIVDRELSVRPTLRVRAGAPVRVLVTEDIALRPYRGAR